LYDSTSSINDTDKNKDKIVTNCLSPIFILGPHKSGTTLLRSLFDGHSQMFAIPFESHYFKFRGYWIRSEYQKAKPKLNSNEEFIKNTKAYLEQLNSKTYNLADGFVQNQIDIGKYIESVQNIKYSKSEINRITIYFNALYEALEGKPNTNNLTVIEKSVEHAEFALELYQMFPRAKFIHIVRNSYANVVSLRRFKQKCGHFPLYSRLFATICSNYYALYKNKSLIPNYFVIKYEDLITNPEQSIQKLCKYLGVKFESILTTPTIHNVQWHGNSSTGSILNGIDSSKIDNWKMEIYPIEIALVNQLFDFIVRDFQFEAISQHGPIWKMGKGEYPFRYLANRIYYKTIMY